MVCRRKLITGTQMTYPRSDTQNHISQLRSTFCQDLLGLCTISDPFSTTNTNPFRSFNLPHYFQQEMWSRDLISQFPPYQVELGPKGVWGGTLINNVSVAPKKPVFSTYVQYTYRLSHKKSFKCEKISGWYNGINVYVLINVGLMLYASIDHQIKGRGYYSPVRNCLSCGYTSFYKIICSTRQLTFI